MIRNNYLNWRNNVRKKVKKIGIKTEKAIKIHNDGNFLFSKNHHPCLL